MRRFELTPTAIASLESIARYTETNWGRVQRDRYIGELDACFHRLAENPNHGKRRYDLEDVLYSFPKNKHVIYYFIYEDHIRIADILHQSEDIPAKF